MPAWQVPLNSAKGRNSVPFILMLRLILLLSGVLLIVSPPARTEAIAKKELT